MPQNKMIDLSYLISVCNNDKTFKIEMIETFLNNIPEILSEMEAAVSQEEWKKTGDLAHKLKPSFIFMGIETAKDLILFIELNGRNNENTEQISNNFKELNDLFKNASVELIEELNDIKKDD